MASFYYDRFLAAQRKGEGSGFIAESRKQKATTGATVLANEPR